MEAISGIFIFMFGLIVGSFLNVVILRYNTGISVGGRSGCMSCGKQLRWYELVPVVSFLLQRGRCAGCHARLSWQYPVVELLTGLLFLVVHMKFFTGIFDFSYILNTTYFMLSMSLLMVIVVYDIRHTIIPDSFVFALAALGGIGLFLSFSPLGLVLPMWLQVLAGPLAAAPFFLLWLVSKGRWMGLGDAKLAWALGWLLAPFEVLSALIFAFWLGALWGVGVIILQRIGLFWGGKPLTMKSELPFAPFMIVGFWIVFFGGITLSLFTGI